MAVEAGILFYKRLFLEHPELEPVFYDTLEHHGRTLMNLIAVAVDKLDDLDQVTDAVEELGGLLESRRASGEPLHACTINSDPHCHSSLLCRDKSSKLSKAGVRGITSAAATLKTSFRSRWSANPG